MVRLENFRPTTPAILDTNTLRSQGSKGRVKVSVFRRSCSSRILSIDQDLLGPQLISDCNWREIGLAVTARETVSKVSLSYGRPRWRPTPQKPYQVKERLQNLQEKTHSV